MPKKRRTSSPYWDWVANHFPCDDTGQALEPKEANPGMLAGAETPEKPLELQAAISVVSGPGFTTLTERQRQCFEFVIKRGFTVGRTARLLGISRQAASGHLKAAGKKLREMCERKLRRMKDE